MGYNTGKIEPEGSVQLQVNYTDTQYSHRFVRFEALRVEAKIGNRTDKIPNKLINLADVKKHLNKHLKYCESMPGVKLCKLQEDKNIEDQEGNVLS